jgi:hypothetical protein
MTSMTLIHPMKEPVQLAVLHQFNTRPAAGTIIFGGIMICAMLATYALLW